MGKRTENIHAIQKENCHTCFQHIQSEIQEKLKVKSKDSPNQLARSKLEPQPKGPTSRDPGGNREPRDSLQPLLKKISNLEEGVEKLEGEPRKWLFQGQLGEAEDCRLSSDNPWRPRGRKRCCRLGGSWARADGTDLVMSTKGSVTSWCRVLKSPQDPNHHGRCQYERQ